MTIKLVYAIISLPDDQIPEHTRGEVMHMEYILNLLISVEAGLIVEIIRIWLNGGNDR